MALYMMLSDTTGGLLVPSNYAMRVKRKDKPFFTYFSEDSVGFYL